MQCGPREKKRRARESCQNIARAFCRPNLGASAEFMFNLDAAGVGGERQSALCSGGPREEKRRPRESCQPAKG